MDGLKQRINELRVYTAEEEWFEFKDSWYDEVGIADKKRKIQYVGTDFVG